MERITIPVGDSARGDVVFRFRLILLTGFMAVLCGCRHHRNCNSDSCDRERLGDRIRDRLNPSREQPKSDPGILRDPVVPPGVIPPRSEPLPTTPRYYTPSTTMGPVLESPIGGKPPASVPSDPLPQRSQRELLLPDEAPDPLLKSQSNYPSDPFRGILLDPIASGSKSDLPDDVTSNRVLLEPEPVSPKSGDLPDSVPDNRKPANVAEFEYVPGFTNVANGRKPLTEGLSKLKSQGFKTVAYLHEPKADLSATKSLVEKAGLKFVPLEINPATLKDSYSTFVELLNDSAARPLYIADDDGVRAGSLWYVYFRKHELLDNDQARLRAGRLGLKDPAHSETQKQFWLAINQLLSK